jgi:hypothetical protein
MKLISILVPSLMTIASLGLLPLRAIAFSVTTPVVTPAQTREAQLQTRLFGNTTPLQITTFNLGDIPLGFGLFQDDDFLGLGQGLVMSTGKVDRLAGVNTADGSDPSNPEADLNFDFTNTDPATGNPFIDPITGKTLTAPKDRIVLDILFNADQSGSLNFNYVFGSEEFPEFVPANPLAASDIFRVLLADSNNQLQFNTATSVANAAFKANPIGNPNTPLDGYTNPIGVRIPFQQGRNRLIFTIEDVGDEGYDSTAFLQQISVQMDPVASVPTPPLLFGFAWMGFLRWRDRCKRR